MLYDWKIELDGTDISAKVARFDITADLDQYARELTIEIADPAFYAALDFSVIPDEPLLEVFSKVDAAWVSQGKFYMERPALASDIHQDVINGLWGRGATARLGAPFAARISKMWSARTSFFGIVEELCALCDLTWSADQSDVDDFYVHEYTYQAENAYPIDIIAELCELAGAVATCDRTGLLRIRAIDYAPSAADVTITDDDWPDIQETPEWPDFGNRIRIVPSGNLAGYSIDLSAPAACLPADGASKARLFARVTDADGSAVTGAAVSWSSDAAAAVLDETETATTTLLMPEEALRADSRYALALAYPPAEVLGVWAWADFKRTLDLAAAGYTIDGNRILLTTPLTYCDQLVRVRYTAAGMATNRLQAGATAEDVIVTAEIGGARATVDIFVGNDCACPAEISLAAEPSSIVIAGVSQLLVCGQEGGAAVMDRLVTLFETGAQAKGTLSWRQARLHEAQIRLEATAAENPVAGVTQCTLRHPVKDGAAISVVRVDEDGNPTGSNLYSSRDDRVLLLSGYLATGTALLASYTARGCAVARYRGEIAGTAYLTARMQSNREEGVEARATVRVSDPADPYDTDTGEDDAGAGGYGGSGGDESIAQDEGNCMLDDFSMVVCSGEGDGWYEAEVCCKSGGVYGCFARSACEEENTLDECTPALLSAEPGQDADRFADLKAAGCDCVAICQAEFARLGTTQGYDEGSYRTIAEIVAAEDGLSEVAGGDNTAYWAAYNTRRAAALEDCVADCEAVPLACQPENPATVGAVAVDVAVIGGRAPFAWSVSGTGFSLAAAETDDRLNTLIPGEGACGSADITVTDAAGESVVCSIRSTNGSWLPVAASPCQVTGAPTSGVAMDGWGELVDGKYKVIEEKYFNYGCSSGGTWFGACACGYCDFGGYAEDVCITGHECPGTDPSGNGWPLSAQTKNCCYYVTADGPTDLSWCRYARYRAQYEWSC